MSRWHHLIYTALLVLAVLNLAAAASGTSFCKCTCFNNSTSIPLDGRPASSPARPSDGGNGDMKIGHGTCKDCDKKFCLGYNLPICKDAKEENVYTTCFQRDSAKDEAVVFIFIFATVGLLLYAAVKPCVERWMENIRERRSYIPISDAAAEES